MGSKTVNVDPSVEAALVERITSLFTGNPDKCPRASDVWTGITSRPTFYRSAARDLFVRNVEQWKDAHAGEGVTPLARARYEAHEAKVEREAALKVIARLAVTIETLEKRNVELVGENEELDRQLRNIISRR